MKRFARDELAVKLARIVIGIAIFLIAFVVFAHLLDPAGTIAQEIQPNIPE